MFKKLRRRFIGIATLSVTLVLFVVITVLNSAYYYQVFRSAQVMTTSIVDNQGQIPQTSQLEAANNQLFLSDGNHISYMSVVANQSGSITSLTLSEDLEMSQSQVQTRVSRILNRNQTNGIITIGGKTFLFEVDNGQNQGEKLLVFLNISSIFEFGFFWLSLRVSLISLVFFIIIITIISGRIIRPFVRNNEKQKRFITNASHELKTPVAIISANNELQEMMSGETEWTKSTTDQTKRLTEMINQMVTLARLEEQPDVVLTDLNFSDIVQDAAEDFKSSVIKDQKTFEMSITPDLHVKAEEKSLFELVTILVDNANKYCDPGGTVSVSLTPQSRRRRKARLVVSNTYAAGKDVDYSKFFERFYREDESHNRKEGALTTGFGVGLSTAESMVKLFKGKISVSYTDDTIHFTVVL